MSAPEDWFDFNRTHLTHELDRVRRWLERHIQGGDAAETAPVLVPKSPPDMLPAIQVLSDRFGLSPFERHVLLLVAGMELDSRIATLAADAGGVNFGLALAMLPHPHWSAIGTNAPLRHWRMIEVGTGTGLVQSPLRIDEYILAFLLGQTPVDRRLAELSAPLPETSLAPSQLELAERLTLIWRACETNAVLPILQLTSKEERAPSATVAAVACSMMAVGLTALSATALPLGMAEIDLTARLCERHARLCGSAILLVCDGGDEPDPAREAAIGHWVERLEAPLFLAGRKRRQTRHRPILNFEVGKPTAAEQQALWHAALGDDPATEPAARQLAAQFDLASGMIGTIAADAYAGLAPDDSGSQTPFQALWDATRRQSRPHLDDLAQRIETQADWSDLILPAPQLLVLHGIQAQLSQRPTVYEDWGFGAKGDRGLGLAALFAGSSGTGKTTAAEILAKELRLDLYRVDLSAVVSKYIGETEKNLRRVFDAAEEGGAVLLFDEADALFGKRTEVSDSHDRHANVEVSYLLQRIETFRGLAILTSNMKNALDTAFLRRLRFIVNFPFPDAGLRAEIWRRIFPPATPTAGLDFGLLAQLSLSGGQIRTVALNAAFQAAAAGTPVGMAEIRTAARMEYAKQDKLLTDIELKGWPA